MELDALTFLHVAETDCRPLPSRVQFPHHTFGRVRNLVRPEIVLNSSQCGELDLIIKQIYGTPEWTSTGFILTLATAINSCGR